MPSRFPSTPSAFLLFNLKHFFFYIFIFINPVFSPFLWFFFSWECHTGHMPCVVPTKPCTERPPLPHPIDHVPTCGIPEHPRADPALLVNLWQTHGVASSCLARGFAPTTRPQWVIRGLRVLLFVKQGSQQLPQSICGPTDVNSSVFTPSSCNVNFCVCAENMIHFYSRCLRAELVIRSPILISPSAASYYSFGIQITWVFTQASGLEKWGSSEICLTD